jgi:P-type Cu+ transporter
MKSLDLLPTPTTEIDPVCGMTVDPQTTAHRQSLAGNIYYFCSAGCQAKFAADPPKYLGSAAGKPPPAPVPQGTIYTCPMHPQIRQVEPGSCPICGMTLEPVKTMAEVGESNELADMTRRFWVGLVMTLPVFVLEMGGHIPPLGLRDLVSPRISIWIQFVLSTPVVL